MRKIFNRLSVNFFLLLSLLWLVLIVPGDVSAQVVDIPDPGLRAAIAEALDKAPGDPITRAEMGTLTQLRAIFDEVADLRGLEFAINLQLLDLSFNRISGISPLSGLTKLTRLFLWGNNISDISPLTGLTNLTSLYLSGNNNISDISPLSGLTSLTALYIADNRISDISPLAGLTSLTFLDLDGNDISNMWLLSGLTNLRILSVSHNSISDISAVATLTNLISLYLNRNSISDISAVATLTNLTQLHLWDNSISDISAVATLTSLEYLSLGGNNVSDISVLVNLPNLTHLHLPGNNVSDIETLNRLIAQGTVVYFSGNPAFETPGPKIEDGWVWLVVPATGVNSGFQAVASGRDFLAEASGGAVTETDVANNGASAGTRVGNSVWTAASLDATDRNNLNAIIRDNNLGTDIRYPVAYGVVSLQSQTQQETRVYIGGGPVRVWFNGALIYTDSHTRSGNNYETAVPVTLTPGKNLLFVAAYRPSSFTNNWAAFFGLQNDAQYSVPARLDVNGDGQVTAADLAIVALFYGIQVPGGALPADVNSDGIVNVLDLVAVAQGIDASNSSDTPSADDVASLLEAIAAQGDIVEGVPEAPGSSAYHNVAAALADAKHLAAEDARLKEGVDLLETLLQILTTQQPIPEQTALLPNYPNPFNPETWIPYHLANASHVQITIFDTRGSVVRKLDLGHQPEGYYTNKVHAAHWDGTNDLGEPVASGVYFYQLQADKTSMLRKMLILK